MSRRTRRRCPAALQRRVGADDRGFLCLHSRAAAHRRTLGALDDKIELNRRMNRTLESIARAIFKSWFVDFDPVRKKMEGGDVGLPPALSAEFPAPRAVAIPAGDARAPAEPDFWGRGLHRYSVRRRRPRRDRRSLQHPGLRRRQDPFGRAARLSRVRFAVHPGTDVGLSPMEPSIPRVRLPRPQCRRGMAFDQSWCGVRPVDR